MVEVGVNDDRSESAELCHKLHEEFPHEAVEGTTEGWLVKETLRRSQPPTGHITHYVVMITCCK